MKIMIEKIIKERFYARNFCTAFEKESSLFDVSIDGIGSIKLPIQPKVARQLIEHASPSKFGFKEKTLYDPSVRNSFEIGSDKIQLNAVFWKQLNASLQLVKKDLLFPLESKLRAELHNMLIYEKGCFFDFHQDTEKQDGMMASLIMILPSNYRGGELVIEYQGQTKEFEGHNRYSRHKDENLKFIAFYADCLHKLKKVTYGYRVALTFNLILENPKELKNNKNHTAATRALREYFSTREVLSSYCRENPKWFVYLLNHQYTEKSLNWKTLKGVDKEAASLFKQAAQDLDLEIHLTLADIQETWNVSDDSRGRYRYQYEDDEDDCENDYDADNLELEEIINSETVRCPRFSRPL